MESFDLMICFVSFGSFCAVAYFLFFPFRCRPKSLAKVSVDAIDAMVQDGLTDVT